MTREDIIRMAREAGLHLLQDNESCSNLVDYLERFAALVAAAAKAEEREACAKVCEDLDAWDEDDPGSSASRAIRARGQA